MTFDSLRPRYDHASSITASMTADGPRPFAFSPVYETSADIGAGALALGDPTDALGRSVMMSNERKAYLAGRWAHRQTVEQEVRRDSERVHPRQLGRE